MSGKQHRIARREAYNIATTRNFWKQCRDFAPKSLRFFASIFSFAKRRLDEITGRIYRANLKRITADAYASRTGTRAHAELVSLQRARRKAEKARVKAKLLPPEAKAEQERMIAIRAEAKAKKKAKADARLRAKLGPRYIEKAKA